MTPRLLAEDVAFEGRLLPTRLSVGPGTLTAVIGPNGSGKTSLLRRLAGIARGGGIVRIDGRELEALSPGQRRQAVSFLPASREVAWPIAVRDVIALGLDRRDDERVDELLETLGLEPLASRAVDRLSTGERARVLLARALAPRPALLLLDEPLSNLDPAWVLRILKIARQAVSDGAAALISVHDIDLLTHFDRVFLMGDHALRAEASPSEILAGPEIARWFKVSRAEGGWRLV